MTKRLPLSLKDSFRQRVADRLAFSRDNVLLEYTAADPMFARIMWRAFFVACCVLPSLLSAVYYGLIASDQYVSEMRMIVRTIGLTEATDNSGNESVRIGGLSLTQDAHVVANFIESEQMLAEIGESIDLQSVFGNSEIDYISRLSPGASSSELLEYWKDQIYTYVDGPSGIVTVGIRAYSPENARRLADAALTASQEMINDLSLRARQEVVFRAEAEVQTALADVVSSLSALRDYQNEVGILNPLSNAEGVGNLINGLIARKLEAEARYTVMLSNDLGGSPVAQQLAQLIETLNAQIEKQQQALTGEAADIERLSGTLVSFARLETNRRVAQEIYEAARRNLDVAKSTALRGTTYLAVFSPAQLAEDALYPRRFESWLLTTLGAIIFWTCGLLLWASIEDHRN